MLKRVAIVAVLLILALLVFAATRPDTFRVQRATTINAPPEAIFALINDFRDWGSWSPFERLDPGMKRTYSGPPSGEGSVYEWKGNRRAGAGRMEITKSTRPSRVAIRLDFFRPIEGYDTIEFTLDPRGSATNVTWSMQGVNPYLGKIAGVFCNMDKLVGRQFETGLANLKTVAEKHAASGVGRPS